MNLSVWILRVLAVLLLLLMIYPTGFDTFLANGGEIIWTTTYIYLVGLVAAAWGLRLAFMSEPMQWHKILGYALVTPLLILIVLIEFVGAHDI